MKPLSGENATVACDPSEVKDPATVRLYPSPERFWAGHSVRLGWLIVRALRPNL